MRVKKISFAVLVVLAAFSAASYAEDKLNERLSSLQSAIKAQGAKWVAGETSISRLPYEDWKQLCSLTMQAPNVPMIQGQSASAAGLPAAIDWRNMNGNYVSAIKHQKKCGSCWAFAMTGALESYVMLSRGSSDDVDLAEQVMVSCSGVGSCKGGTLNAGYLKSAGLPPEKAYPYIAANGSCSDAAQGWQNEAEKIFSWGGVWPTQNAIKTALAKYGPLPITMFVYEDFMDYKSGIYTHVSGKKLGGHAVLLVGYDDAEKYFVVKNSWGTDWGESGFFRIAYSQVSGSVHFGLFTIAYYSQSANWLSTALSRQKTGLTESEINKRVEPFTKQKI